MLRDHRDKIRVAFNLPFELVDSFKQKHTVIGANFSESGVACFSFLPVSTGTDVTLNIPMPGHAMKLSLSGVVRRNIAGIKQGVIDDPMVDARYCHTCGIVFASTEEACTQCNSTYFEDMAPSLKYIQHNIYWLGIEFSVEAQDPDIRYKMEEMSRQMTEFEDKEIFLPLDENIRSSKNYDAAFIEKQCLGGAYIMSSAELKVGQDASFYIESDLDSFTLDFKTISRYFLNLDNIEMNGYLIRFNNFSLNLTAYLKQLMSKPSTTVFVLTNKK